MAYDRIRYFLLEQVLIFIIESKQFVEIARELDLEFFESTHSKNTIKCNLNMIAFFI